MDEYIYLWAQWGALNSSTGLTLPHQKYLKIKEYFGDLKTAWKKINVPFLMQFNFGREKSERLMEIKQLLDFRGIVDQLDRFKSRILCIDDKEYPECLRNIPDPPVFLYVCGSLPPLHKALAVVGTRAITSYGTHVTKKFTTDLVHNGFVIVSGLAMGVDALAHQTTLDNLGTTVAVLGTGIDRLYPRQNAGLANEILKSGGAIVSEYPMGTRALQHHFPARNRIISGLSRGTLIIEGGDKSGALITAGCANDQGRGIYAIPKNITGQGLSGTNKIIRNSKAKLVENVNHILEDLRMENSDHRIPIELEPVETELIEHIKNEGKSIDELTVETKTNVARLSEMLIMLQLKGVVREVGGEWVLI